jgi:hypothetical protein
MGDPADHQEQPSGHRGEVAWREHMERIAARNDRARKEAKTRREAEERAKDRARRERERRELAALVGKHGRP